MQERWWFRDSDWYHKWELVRAGITEVPSPEGRNIFLRNVPFFEERFLTGVSANLEYWKSQFERTRSGMATKGKEFTLPEFCRLVLDYEVAGLNLQRNSPDLSNESSLAQFVLLYEFFSEMMFLLSPLGHIQKTEREIVTASFLHQRLLEREEGLPSSGQPHGPSATQIRTYQTLMQEDPTGFKLVDYQLEYIRDLEKSSASRPLYPIWVAGHEFGNRVYKKLYTILSS